MSVVANWRAKIAVTVKLLSTPRVGGLLASMMPTIGHSVTLKTTQSYLPKIGDNNVDPTHSTSRENIGYMYKPFRYLIDMGLLPIKVGAFSDAELMKALQLERAEFDMDVSSTDGITFGPETWHRCRVKTAQPSNITIDQLPMSTWTCTSLGHTPAPITG